MESQHPQALFCCSTHLIKSDQLLKPTLTRPAHLLILITFSKTKYPSVENLFEVQQAKKTQTGWRLEEEIMFLFEQVKEAEDTLRQGKIMRHTLAWSSFFAKLLFCFAPVHYEHLRPRPDQCKTKRETRFRPHCTAA